MTPNQINCCCMYQNYKLAVITLMQINNMVDRPEGVYAAITIGRGRLVFRIMTPVKAVIIVVVFILTPFDDLTGGPKNITYF